jgi:hypothetical protein
MSNFSSIQFGGSMLLPSNLDLSTLRQELVEFFFSRGCQDFKLNLGLVPHDHPYGKSWTPCEPIPGRVNALGGFSGTLVARDDRGRGLMQLASNSNRRVIINIDWFIKASDDAKKERIYVPRDKSRGDVQSTKTKLQRQLDELD